jgi:hypothetical protein
MIAIERIVRRGYDFRAKFRFGPNLLNRIPGSPNPLLAAPTEERACLMTNLMHIEHEHSAECVFTRNCAMVSSPAPRFPLHPAGQSCCMRATAHAGGTAARICFNSDLDG